MAERKPAICGYFAASRRQCRREITFRQGPGISAFLWDTDLVVTSTQDRFSRALDALVARIREDRSILAALLCGSLSHDTVWDKSDIDLVLVTMDDGKLAEEGLALNADGINVHALLMSRTDFRTAAERSLRSGFFHSFLTKGRLLYTHEAGIATLCERLSSIGKRDIRVQLLNAAGGTLPAIDPATYRNVRSFDRLVQPDAEWRSATKADAVTRF